MGLRAGVFCHNALGDGFTCLTLSHNLQINGFDVETYQNSLGPIQSWFPHLPILPYPSMEELPQILEAYDWYFVVWNDSSEFVKQLVIEGKKRFPKRMKVIYIYPSPNIVNEPYYADCLINPKLSVSENMRLLCEKVMCLPNTIRKNGMTIPQDLIFRKYSKRIVVHPTSGRPTRNWPKEKFVKLALHLKWEGFEPVFVPGPQGIEQWRDISSQGLEIGEFSSLDSLARFIYESGYLLGNDSGLGHLASSLGIETVTICRRKALANLWAPSFIKGEVVTPSSWLPNIRGFRLRDLHWQKFVTVGMVYRAFKKLILNRF